jgi:hypothetical protein
MAHRQKKIKIETMYYWTKIGVVAITTQAFKNNRLRHKFMCKMARAMA